jgi:hypothetical protein
MSQSTTPFDSLFSPHASLAALAAQLNARGIFDIVRHCSKALDDNDAANNRWHSKRWMRRLPRMWIRCNRFSLPSSASTVWRLPTVTALAG